MRHLPIATLLAALLACTFATAPAAAAGLFDRKPETAAAEAARDHLATVTIWLDATLGMRNTGAASALTRAHAAFAAHGYRLHSIEPYVENGDLQGFFVSYEKR
jgi:hypothetical protein